MYSLPEGARPAGTPFVLSAASLAPAFPTVKQFSLQTHTLRRMHPRTNSFACSPNGLRLCFSAEALQQTEAAIQYGFPLHER